MKKLDHNARILVICVRKSHGVDALRELNDEHNDLGFVLYDDFKGELHTAKRVGKIQVKQVAFVSVHSLLVYYASLDYSIYRCLDY